LEKSVGVAKVVVARTPTMMAEAAVNFMVDFEGFLECL
jgi:hypothetical protein